MHQGAPATGSVIASAARPVWTWIRVNRSFYFPAFVFLLLFALLLLLSGQLSRFSVPRSTRESGKAIDRAAVEKATSTIPQALTKRDLQPDPPSVFAGFRRRFSIVGLFPHPVKIRARILPGCREIAEWQSSIF